MMTLIEKLCCLSGTNSSPVSVAESVALNISNILNSSSIFQFNELPTELKGTLLDYGMSKYVGLHKSYLGNGDIARQISESIQKFEPRLCKSSLIVKTHNKTYGYAQNVIEIFISSKLLSENHEFKASVKWDKDFSTFYTNLANY